MKSLYPDERVMDIEPLLKKPTCLLGKLVGKSNYKVGAETNIRENYLT